MKTKFLVAGVALASALPGVGSALFGKPKAFVANGAVKGSRGNVSSGYNVGPGVPGNYDPNFGGSPQLPIKVGQVPQESKHAQRMDQRVDAQRQLLGLGNATNISKATDIPLEDAIHILEGAIDYMEKGGSSDEGSEHYSKLVEVVEQYLGDKATQFHSQCPEIIWKISLSCKETLGDFKETLDDLLNRLNEMNKVMSSTSVVSSTTPAVTPRPEVPVNATNSTDITQAIKNITTVLSTTLAGIMTTPPGNDLKDTILKNLSNISEGIQNLTTLYNGSNHTNINYTEAFAPFNPHHTTTTYIGTPAPFNPHHTTTTYIGTPAPITQNPLVYSGINGTRDFMTNVSNDTNFINVKKSSDSSTSDEAGVLTTVIVVVSMVVVSALLLASRNLVTNRRKNRAATKLQSVVRAHLGRQERLKELKKQKDEAATKLQSVFRGHLGRQERLKELKKQKDEAATKLHIEKNIEITDSSHTSRSDDLSAGMNPDESPFSASIRLMRRRGYGSDKGRQLEQFVNAYDFFNNH